MQSYQVPSKVQGEVGHNMRREDEDPMRPKRVHGGAWGTSRMFISEQEATHGNYMEAWPPMRLGRGIGEGEMCDHVRLWVRCRVSQVPACEGGGAPICLTGLHGGCMGAWGRCIIMEKHGCWSHQAQEPWTCTLSGADTTHAQ